MKVKRILLTWIIGISFVFSTAAFGHAYSNILAFGDSLSDNGNLARDTNGPVWVEYLADAYHLNVPLVDVACAGATTSFDNPAAYAATGLPIFLTATGLQWQVAAYQANYGTISSNTLVTVWAGANDFFQGRPYDTAASNVASAIQQLANDGGKYFLVPYLI